MNAARSQTAGPLPRFVPKGPTEPVTWVRVHGIEVLVPSADQVVTPYMQRKREWDGTLLSAVLDSLDPKTTFLDVGAMVGYFSCVVAKRIPSGRVVAVEPSRANLELASLNLSSFDNAVVLAGAISNAPDSAWGLVPDETNRGNTRIEQGVVSDESIATCTLNDVIRHYGADVVKIDVQGMEKDVLDSLDLQGRLPADLTLFCEFTPDMWNGEAEITALVTRFADAGFDAYFLSETSAYSAFSAARLTRRVQSGSTWADHFEMIFTRGRYAAKIRNRG
jgi:FkbM family methyltransferase